MPNRFDILETPLQALKLLRRNPIGDQRGYLERLFCIYELADVLHGKSIVQINHTFTMKTGTVRGMHFQHPPHAEIKFVMCAKGEIFDVAVDLRRNSPTFLQWHAEVLSANNHKTLIIPEGFAHGFQTLTEDCELLYLHTNFYAPAAESGVNIQDPRLGIKWPIGISEISDRDSKHSLITNEFKGIKV